MFKILKNRSRCVIPLFLGLLVLGACQSDSYKNNDSAKHEKARAYYQIALNFFQDEAYPESLAHLQKALELRPDFTEASMLLGLNYLKMAKPREAIQLYQNLCAAKSDHSACWNNLSASYLSAERYSEAIEAANVALGNDTYPTPELALANRARAELALNQEEKALESLRQARKRAPRNCIILVWMAKAHLQQKRFEEALEDTELAARLCPRNASVQSWEAFALYRIGRRKAAAEKFSYVANEFKRDPAAEYSLKALNLMRKRIPLKEPPLD